MAKPRAKKGDVVRVTFLDHVEGADKPLEFYLYGRVFEAARTYYVIDSWCYPAIDVATADDRAENIHQTTILRSTISEMIIYV